MVKERIESIFPLSHMQGALLFHKLQAQRDEGFLQLSCSISGPLDVEIFQKAWQEVSDRHAVLRTSLHWEDISQPVQVIQPQVQLTWQLMDWRGASSIEERFAQLRDKDAELDLPLSQAPVSRFQLIQVGEASYHFLWSYHHILLDGWSSMLLLEEVMELYEADVEDRPAKLASVPAYKDYLYWKSQLDSSAERTFWEGYLADFENPVLVGKKESDTSEVISENSYQIHRLEFADQESELFRRQAQEIGIPPNTLLQAIWAIVLGKWFHAEDIVYGLTVSGRAGSFPGIGRMAQAMMNLVPVRIQLATQVPISTFLKDLQKELAQVGKYEYTPLSHIQSWLKWPSHTPLFDNLLVFQGLPWEALEKGKVMVSQVEGKAVSVFPLTLLIDPQRKLSVTFRYDPELVDLTLIAWAGRQVTSLVSLLSRNLELSVSELMAQLEPSPIEYEGAALGEEKEEEKTVHLAASSSEILLTRIWEQVLGTHELSVTDNFFEVGGTSILAVQIMAEINRHFQVQLAPVSLLTHPTIRQLGPLLTENSHSHWASLVAVQPKGTRPPLFVLHDIGGDIFIYRDLAKYLGEDQPLYAFQAKGLDGEASTLESVSDLADYYITEIQRVYPDGPFLLGGTSFGGLVAYEMGRKLIEAGQEVDLLALFDTYPYRGPFPYGRTGSPAGPKWMEKLDVHVGRWMVKGTQSRIRHYRKKVSKLFRTKLPFLTYKEDIPPERNQRIWDANALAIKNYYQEPYNGCITLFMASDYYARFYQDVRLGWHAYALKGLELHIVPGDHLTMMYPPNVEVLAKELTACIDRVVEKYNN